MPVSPRTKTRHPAPFIEGISNIKDEFDHFILDIFGVLHDGLEPFPGTVKALTGLKEAGKQVCLLSNTPRRAEGALEQMEIMGISRDLVDHIVTSGEATHYALKERPDDFHQSCGQECWFIGDAQKQEMLDGLDLNAVNGPQEASFMVNSITARTQHMITEFKHLLEESLDKDLPMICANPDLVVNVGDKQYECAGAFAALYENMGGRVVYHGKPHAPVYERCYELLGKPPKNSVVAIGDSLHTDIAGANNFGIASVFNLVGIHWEEVRMDHRPQEADLEKVRLMVEAQPHHPSYTMAGFAW